MKKFITWAVVALLCVVSLVSCTSTLRQGADLAPAIVQFSATFEGVCGVWGLIRERYPQIRESAILLRDLGGLDDDTWAAFGWIDQNAPRMDRWLGLVCEAEAGAQNAHVIAREKAGVDWNQVGSAILKVTTFALQSGLL